MRQDSDKSYKLVPESVTVVVSDRDTFAEFRDHFFPESKRDVLAELNTSDNECRSFDYFSAQHEKRREPYFRIILYILTAALAVGLVNGALDRALNELRFARLHEMSWLAEQTGAVFGPMGVMILWTGLSGLLVSLLVVFVAPAASGGGVADMRAYLNGNMLRGLLSKRTLIIRVLAIPLATSCGAMLGSQGPLAHVGMIILDLVSRFLSRGRMSEGQLFDVATAGSGIGMAAALNAPLSGVLFAFEDTATFWRSDLFYLTLSGSIVAVTVSEFTSAGFRCDPESSFCISHEGEFAVSSASLTYQPWELPLFIFCGSLCGVLTVCVSKAVIVCNSVRARMLNKSSFSLRVLDTVLTFSLTAVVFCLCTLATSCVSPISDLPFPGPLTVSSGLCPSESYNAIALILLEPQSSVIRTLYSAGADIVALDNQANLWLSFIALTVTFIVTASVAAPTGMFIPNVFLGSVFGRIFGSWISHLSPSVSPGVYALAGSCAFLSGVFRSSIWIAVVMIESSGATYLAIPVILSIASSKLVADILMPVSLIECSMRAKRQRFIPPRISENTTELSIKDLMTSPVVCILETETVAATCAVLNAFPFGHFPVVNSNGRLVGIASRTDVETKIRDAQQNDTVRINFGGKKIPITTIRPDSTINHGHILWNSLGLAIIPVTDTSNRLEGVITRSNFFRGIKN